MPVEAEFLERVHAHLYPTLLDYAHCSHAGGTFPRPIKWRSRHPILAVSASMPPATALRSWRASLQHLRTYIPFPRVIFAQRFSAFAESPHSETTLSAIPSRRRIRSTSSVRRAGSTLTTPRSA
jgi:hypothetical protein